ncbi:MAG: O-antigen ligase family protein, partial [Verrucomicrobia bacterium]|nr:O-antigen ligase family protein [Verrucomicrobiota bacterium]
MDPAEHKKPVLFAGLARERVDAWLQWGILGLVLAALVFAPLASGGVRPSAFLVLQFLTAGLLLLWLARCWFGKTHRLLWTPVCWAVVGFVAYAICRYATADIEYSARQELVRVLVYAALFLAILTHLHHQETIWTMAVALAGTGAVLSLYAVQQWLTNRYFKPACGTFLAPDHLAGFLGMVMPIALSYTLTGRLRPVVRVLLGYASLMMMAGVAVTVSYGAWLASGVALIVFFAIIMRQHSYRLAGLFSLLIILSGSMVFYFGSLRPRAKLLAAQAVYYEQSPQTGVWSAAWRMWLDHPWVGVGPGLFEERFREYRPASEKLQTPPAQVHNDCLNTLADWGLLGAMLVVLAWGLLLGGVFWGWKFIRRSSSGLTQKKSNKSAFVLGASLGLLTLLTQSFFSSNLHVPANAILTVTLMALISSHLRFASERFWVTQRLKGQILATILLGLSITCLTWEGARLALEQGWLRRAGGQTQSSDARLAGLRKAFEREPKNFATARAIGEHLLWQSQQRAANSHDLDAAVVWYQRSLSLNPHQAGSLLGLGLCEHELGHPEQAAPWFEQALRLDPNGYETLCLAGWHYFQLGQFEKARERLAQSLKLRPAGSDPLGAASRLRPTEGQIEDIRH